MVTSPSSTLGSRASRISGCSATGTAEASPRIVASPAGVARKTAGSTSRRGSGAEAGEGGHAALRAPGAATPGGDEGEPETPHLNAARRARAAALPPGEAGRGGARRAPARGGRGRWRSARRRGRGARRRLRPVAPSPSRTRRAERGAAAATAATAATAANGSARGNDSGLRRGPARPPAVVLRFADRAGPVTMSLSQRLARLAARLQDPQKVARFQRLCGVEAPPSRSAAAAAVPREGEKAEAPLSGDTPCRERQPGACGGPQPPGSDRNQCPAKPGGGGGGGAPNGVRNGLAAELGPASPRRAGALRRNSLTGEEGELAHVSNWPLYYLFCFGTELGNELFYILFFPFWIWNLDALVGRRLVIIWVLVMYLGQCTKDIVRWPRPASPPVVKLEVFYNSEYSMPSTHAMSGTAIPIVLVLLTYGRWQVRCLPLAPRSPGA